MSESKYKPLYEAGDIPGFRAQEGARRRL